MTTIVAWPYSIRCLPMEPRLVNQTISGGRALNGMQQVIDSDTAFWAVDVKLPRVQITQVRAYRRFLAKLGGRSNLVRVPICDPWKAFPTDGDLPGGTLLPWDDGHPWDDDIFWADETNSAPLRVTVAAGQTSFTIDATRAADTLQEGVFFNIGQRLHLVTDIEGEPDNMTVRFVPAARENHELAPLGFRPALLASLASDDSGTIDTSEPRRIEAVLTFEEHTGAV